jgi:hypothetical protein
VGDKLKTLLAEYGQIALIIYLVIFAGTIVSFWAAINAGIEVEGAAAQGGTWFAAWAATKVTQPIRIGATLVLTPFVGKVFGIKPQDLGAAQGATEPTAEAAAPETAE